MGQREFLDFPAGSRPMAGYGRRPRLVIDIVVQVNLFCRSQKHVGGHGELWPAGRELGGVPWAYWCH